MRHRVWEKWAKNIVEEQDLGVEGKRAIKQELVAIKSKPAKKFIRLNRVILIGMQHQVNIITREADNFQKILPDIFLLEMQRLLLLWIVLLDHCWQFYLQDKHRWKGTYLVDGIRLWAKGDNRVWELLCTSDPIGAHVCLHSALWPGSVEDKAFPADNCHKTDSYSPHPMLPQNNPNLHKDLRQVPGPGSIS